MAHCRRGDEYIVGQDGAHLPLRRRRRRGARQHPAAADRAPAGRLRSRSPTSRRRSSPTTRTSRARGCCAWRTRIGGKVLPLDYLRERDRAGARARPGARTWTARACSTPRSPRACRAARSRATSTACRSAFARASARRWARRCARPRALIARAHRVRKMLGGGMRQAGVLAAAASARARPPRRAPGRGPRPRAAARRWACSSVRGVERRSPPHTNMVFVDVAPGRGAAGLVEHLRAARRARDRPVPAAPRHAPRRRRRRHRPRRRRRARDSCPEPRRRPAMPITNTRRADAHHRAPRDLPRRDAGADAPDHERRDVAGDDRGDARSACASRRRPSARSPPPRR